MTWTTDDIPDQTGRTVVVTGANSGIGFETCKELARNGARVILACRSIERGTEAARAIQDEVDGADVAVGRLDLASLDSIHTFAEGLADEGVSIDVLFNNAGVMAIPRAKTSKGFEMQLGVNHLGHFALTNLLLDLLAEDARVVTVSSAVHEQGEIDFEDLHSEDSYSKWGAYAQSKLANLLFAYELDRRFDAAGSDRISVGVHPGYADTSLQRRGPRKAGSLLRLAGMKVANALFAQPPAAGALPTLYAATAPAVVGKAYYGPGGFLSIRGSPEKQESSPASYDRETARRLWRLSEEQTGVTSSLPEPEAKRLTVR